MREQDINARSLSKEKFDQLAKNLAKRQGFEGDIPYVAKTEKGLEIVSGHHRVRAARKAELYKIPVVIDLKPMTRQEIISKQLAHNALEGEDNDQFLARLYSQISDAELKLATGLDPTALDVKLDSIGIPDMDVGFEWHRVGLLFLPYQLEDFSHVLETLQPDAKLQLVCDLKHWAKFKQAAEAIMTTQNIKSVGMAVARMSEIVLDKLKNESPPNAEMATQK